MSSFIHQLDQPTTFDLYARHVSPGKVQFFQSAGLAFAMGKRAGPFFWDQTGEKRLIDCHTNGGVFSLGHRHPEIIAALRASLDELDIGNHHLISEQRSRLAAKLASLAPPGLTLTVFGVGGGEATDLAIKVARGVTGRQSIVSASGGYHGHTGFAIAAGDAKFFERSGPRLPGFVQVPFGDLEALAATVDDQTAAVILETIPATLGMPIPPPDYLPGVRALCDQRGALLILDEVQAGLGRTGQLWACQHFDIAPDVMVLGKGLSGGVYPMSATLLRADLVAYFEPDPFVHISTFGGAEVGCPVALRVLEITSDPAFLAHVTAIAGLFQQGFAELSTRHGALVRLRQLGMMMGIELIDPQLGLLFSRLSFEHGLFTVYAYNDPRVVQFMPPLIIDQPLAAEILDRVEATLTSLEQMIGL